MFFIIIQIFLKDFSNVLIWTVNLCLFAKK